MITYGEIEKAFIDCYKKKKKTPGAEKFIMGGYHSKLLRLTDDINFRTYKPLPSTVFYIRDPKPREIFAADFRDRIIHHLIIRELMPLFQDYFIPTSFSCMPGRGTLVAVFMMSKFLEEAVQRGWWVMKMDIQSFFMSIRKSILAKRLEKFIREGYRDQRKLEDLVWLTRVITLLDPTSESHIIGTRQYLPPGKSLFDLPPDFGLPIGNYSSQVFANFFMTTLDYYVMKELGLEMYGRYVDDFLMFGPREKLIEVAPKIREFAWEELGLVVSPSKFYLQPSRHGVKFVGSFIMPGRIYAGNRVRGELEKILHQKKPELDTLHHYQSVVNSYLGLLSHHASYNIRHELLSDLSSSWRTYFEVDENYKKINLKTLIV
jgi:hypothetical protein